MKKLNLTELSPTLSEQWDYEANKNYDITSVNSSANVWWRCPKAEDHRWQALICNRLKGGGCPCCSNIKAVRSNCLATTHPEMVKEWEPNLNCLAPTEVTAGSSKRIWWCCLVDTDHIWRAAVVDRTRTNGGCPFCNGKRASSTNNLAARFPELVLEWDWERNMCGPENYRAGSAKKVWWRCCENDRHRWEATINNRTTHKQACPYCSGKKTDGTNSFLIRFPHIAAEWCSTNKNRPSDVLPNSHKKVWWQCGNDKTHRWQASPNSRVSCGAGCPFCSESGGEKIITSILSALGVRFSRQYRFPDCRDKRSLPFDFAVHLTQLGLIEFHGGQHYNPVTLFGGKSAYSGTVKRDKIKERYCHERSISLLVIPYNQISKAQGLITDFIASLEK